MLSLLCLVAAVSGTRLESLRGGARKEKVTVVGSGNWGSAIAKIIGRNVLERDEFNDEVRMWVYQEQIDGKNLTDIINEEHENVKYLKGIKFTDNVVADPDLANACKDSTMLVFVMPHQFIPKKWDHIKLGKGCKAISLIKGIEFDEDGPQLISQYIKEVMSGMDVSVLMGANVANDVANDEFCESTVGYENAENGETWVRLLDCPTLRIGKINDVAGTELCGALKNVVALGAGFCDGLGLGSNTKAAIIRIGLKETAKFARMFFDGILDETFMESCGLADLVTTCFSGRNRKCAEAFAKGQGEWGQIEKELLNGQKLQGTITSKDVSAVLKKKGMEAEFPLFTRINEIAFEGKAPSTIVDL